eukprot:7691892-Lingulodinium_polyedra.AAC.1
MDCGVCVMGHRSWVVGQGSRLTSRSLMCYADCFLAHPWKSDIHECLQPQHPARPRTCNA